MPNLRPYRIFISHAWDYGDDYYRVVRFLDEAPFFKWENFSVPQHDPIDENNIPYELRKRMRDCDAFLIIAGMYATHRTWIDFEMKFARRIGRPIIGIRKWASERVPLAIQNQAREVVGWNGSSVVSAIRRHALKYVTPKTITPPTTELPTPILTRPVYRRPTPPKKQETQPLWWQRLNEPPSQELAPPPLNPFSLLRKRPEKTGLLTQYFMKMLEEEAKKKNGK
jgi:hypothetical protein